MNSGGPQVSVLMSVWNGAETAELAIRSILAQRGVTLELVVVDDGSTDSTPALLERHAAEDARVRLLRNASNTGLTASLNRGLEACRAPLVARMDADDVAHPDRLRLQFAFLQRHGAVGVLGSRSDLFDDAGTLLRRSNERLDHDAIVWRMLTHRSSFVHPTVMMRRALLDSIGRYDDDFAVSQDFDLWHRLLGATRFANLPQALLRYAIGNARVSTRRYDEQVAATQQVMRRTLSRLLDAPLDEQALRRHRAFFKGDGSLSAEEVDLAIGFAERVARALVDTGAMRPVARIAVRRDLEERCQRAVRGAGRVGRAVSLPSRALRRLRRATQDAYLAALHCRF